METFKIYNIDNGLEGTNKIHRYRYINDRFFILNILHDYKYSKFISPQKIKKTLSLIYFSGYFIDKDNLLMIFKIKNKSNRSLNDSIMNFT